MVTRNQAIKIVKNYIGQSQDEGKVDKCKELPNGVDRAQFDELLAVMSKVREKYNF